MSLSVRIKTLFLLVPILYLVWLPGLAQAQGPLTETETDSIEWQELKTEKFTIVYAERVIVAGQEIDCACGVEQAEYYANFIDDIYNDMVVVFDTQLELPVNLRLFPTEQSYYKVNPLAEQIPGVVAHALNSREEIAVALPRTAPLTDEELVNNIRHEMTHLFASFLSDGKLTSGFQEGIAQYLEKPTDKSSQEPALLEQAFEQDRLLSWAELDQARKVYSDPQVAYPQTLAMVSFLIDRYGLPTFIDFIKALATEPGYRSALEIAYGKPADQLEAEWLLYLPEYFDGRWQINAVYAYDLSDVIRLVENAAYTDAETRLTEIIALLEATDQREVLAQAEALLARTHQGQTAGALADEARAALQAGDYNLAIEKGNAAIEAYEAVNYRDRIPEIQNYIYRAELGRDALAQLDQGEQLLDSLRFFEAENRLHEATAVLQTLDNQPAAQRGTALLTKSAQQQKLLVYLVMVVAALMLIFNGARRIFNRIFAEPLEMEFS